MEGIGGDISLSYPSLPFLFEDLLLFRVFFRYFFLFFVSKEKRSQFLTHYSRQP